MGEGQAHRRTQPPGDVPVGPSSLTSPPSRAAYRFGASQWPYVWLRPSSELPAASGAQAAAGRDGPRRDNRTVPEVAPGLT